MRLGFSGKELGMTAAVAAAYLAASHLSLAADVIEPYVSPLWPGAGVALAFLVKRRPRCALGVLAGSFASLILFGLSWPPALFLAACNAAEIAAAAWALARLGLDGARFRHPKDYLVFTAVTGAAALASSAPAAWVIDVLPPQHTRWLPLWVARSLAHWSAMLIVAPAFLLWLRHRRISTRPESLVEALGLGATTAVVLWYLFAGASAASVANYPLSFALLPLILWPAVRYGLRETATVLLAVTAGATWGTLHGYGPFASLPRESAISVLQAFVASLAVTSMCLSAAVWRSKDEGAAAEAARTQLSLVTDAIPGMIAYVGSDLRYRFVNAAFLRWHGKRPDEVLGRRVEEILAAGTFEAVKPRIEAALRGELQDFEAQLEVGGRRLWAHLVYVPDLESDGTVDGVVALVMDIGRLKRAETALVEAKRRLAGANAELEKRVARRTARLRQVNEELESFAYAVAHDLRSPLRAMSGFSEALLSDYRGRPLEGRGEDYLKRIFDASLRMARMIDQMLDLSRVARAAERDETVDLSSLARAIADDLAKRQPGRRVRVRVQPGLTDRGDPVLLEGALRHLLDNAWKYTARREEPLVEFGALPQEPVPAYYVRDNGVGLDPDQARRIVSASEPPHKPDFRARGMGLATVQRVVQRHGGRLWAEGEPGRGATFYFTLHEPHA